MAEEAVRPGSVRGLLKTSKTLEERIRGRKLHDSSLYFSHLGHALLNIRGGPSPFFSASSLPSSSSLHLSYTLQLFSDLWAATEELKDFGLRFGTLPGSFRPPFCSSGRRRWQRGRRKMKTLAALSLHRPSPNPLSLLLRAPPSRGSALRPRLCPLSRPSRIAVGVSYAESPSSLATPAARPAAQALATMQCRRNRADKCEEKPW